MDSNCFLGIFCTIASGGPKGGGGDPIKPGYYVEAWAVAVLVIVAFVLGGVIAKRGSRGKP